MKKHIKVLMIIIFFSELFLAQNFWAPTNGSTSFGIIKSIACNSTIAQDFWASTNGSTSFGIIKSIASNSITNDLYAGTTTGGILKSTDSGENWYQSNSGLGNLVINKIFINTNGYIYAGTASGLFYSTNNGNSWISLGLTGSNIKGITISSNGNLIVNNWVSGILRSTNNGVNWVQINNGIPSNLLVDDVIKDEEGSLFAAVTAGSGMSGGILKSTDNGDTWILGQSVSSTGYFFTLNPSNNDIYCMGLGGGYRSTNHGTTWESFNTPTDARMDMVITQDGIMYLATRTLFYSNVSGVFRSTNNGTNWEQVNSGLTGLNIYSISLGNDGNIICGEATNGIFKSTELITGNTLAGYVTDATTGLGIEGATVSVAGLSTTTLANGYYLINNVPPGTLTAEFNGYPLSGTAPLNVQFTDQSTDNTQTVTASKTGYSTYTNNQVVINPTGITTLDMSLSPTLAEGDMRLVLNWGVAPTDLDSHLKTPLIEGNYYHVYFSDKGSEVSPPYAILDHDDVTSYGPETVTIVQFFNGTYYYYVHNYTGEHPINASNGVVQIYNSTGLINTVQSPTTGDGLYWHVCNINGVTKAITVINQIVTTPPGPALLSDMTENNVKKSNISLLKDEVNNLESITSWLWNFGDGNTSTIQHPSHIYQQAGNYTVSLTVDNGTTQITETKTNYITATPLLPDPVLCLDPTTWNAPNSGGTSPNINVTNCGNSETLIFSAIPSNTWLTVSVPDNTTPGYFQVTALANTTGSIRNGTITVSSTGVDPVILSVSQSSNICEHGWIAVTNQQYNMNVVGLLKFDDVVSLTESDAIGAFVGSECRGIASPIASLGGIIFLTISSNQQSGETVEFKSWRSTTCEELPVLESINFVNQGEVGTLENPFVFNGGMVEHVYNFGSGYTWFSVNINPGDMSINSVFNGLAASANDRIIGQTSFAVYDGGTSQWVGSLLTIDPKKMYKMRLAVADNFSLQGLPVNPTTNSISLNPGYTWIGYLPQTSMAINTALANMTVSPVSNDRFIGQTQFAVYDGGSGQWVGSLLNLNPGGGYNIRITNATVLTYPSNTSAPVIVNEPLIEIAGVPDWTPLTNQQYNMMVVGEIVWNNQVSTNPNDMIGAFVGSECRGVAYNNIPTAYGNRFFLTIGSNQQSGENVTFKVYNYDLDQVDENPYYPPLVFENLGEIGTLTAPFTAESPLPVELTSFSAQVSKYQVNLKWQTATETNNYGFEIERKTIDDWQNIGFVNGNGNCNSPKQYSFTDNSLIGGNKFQYRLKQIDNDGQFEYSDIVEVEVSPNEYFLYQNYPNPFNPVTKVRFAIPVASRVNIKLYNAVGEEVKDIINQDYDAGYHEVEINSGELASGIYLYKIVSNNFTAVKKLIIMK
jgi:photosystem II stability/assembly factor-like uncharacterized protein